MPSPSAATSRNPLYAPLANRDATLDKDSRLYNGYAEKASDGDDIWVYKRPGTTLFTVVEANAVGQGCTYWNGDNYEIFGGHFYRNQTLVGNVDATGVYDFSSILGTTPKLFFKNLTTAYFYDPVGGLFVVADSNYPNPTMRGCAYLDGTMYVIDPTAGIHGSDLNDTATWDPLNLLYAQIEPDLPQGIAKQLVYIIAIKSISTEVFYDAGNASGSPLGPVQGSKLGVGCRAPGSICKLGDDLAWIGTTTEGDVQVMLMSKVHGEPISTPSVDKLLSPLDFTTTWSWSAKVAGHRFYVVTLVASNLTLVFDLTSGAWYIWTDIEGNYLPFVASTYDSLGRVMLQHATNGGMYLLSAQSFADGGVPFTLSLFTPTFDGGVHTAKSNSRVEIIADRDPTTVQVSWSDDDYQTFSSPVPLTLDQDRPWLQDGSTFSRRAYNITNTDITPLRIKALELTVTPGTS